MEVLMKHIKEAPVPPRALVDDLPEAVSSFILKMMAKDPAERFRDCDEAAEALEGAVEGTTDPSLSTAHTGGAETLKSPTPSPKDGTKKSGVWQYLRSSLGRKPPQSGDSHE